MYFQFFKKTPCLFFYKKIILTKKNVDVNGFDHSQNDNGGPRDCSIVR